MRQQKKFYELKVKSFFDFKSKISSIKLPIFHKHDQSLKFLEFLKNHSRHFFFEK